MNQAVILAGGKGTRLRERLGNLPKPLIDLCGIPLLERQILLLKRYGFNNVLILVNYQAQRIIDFCESKANWGLQIRCIDDGVPRGTAGAVLQIYDSLEPEFLVVYGDTMLNVDLQRFQHFHRQDSQSAASLLLHPNDHPHDSDLVDLNEQQYIQAFHPYPHDGTRYLPNLVNAALYMVRKKAIEPWRNHNESTLDFAKNLFPLMLTAGMSIRGYNSPEYIKDCGTPSRIDKVSADFTSGKIERFALDQEQKAIFLDRDGTLNVEVNHLKSVDQFVLFDGVDDAIKRLNKSEFRTCVVTNQPVIARGECSLEDLRQIHNKFETLLGLKGAFVDRIYFCPHHPDKGFEGEVPELKKQCQCRKPNTGMIDIAVAELNINVKKSWMIGDSTSDLMAAKSAGLKSILVETGFAGLDGNYAVTADFRVNNLPAAVEFILSSYPKLYTHLESLLCAVSKGNVIFIGGYRQTGKSNLASIAGEVFQSRGLGYQSFSIDQNTHFSVDEQGAISGCRFDQNLTEYIGHMLSKSSKHIDMQGDKPDILIVEGVAALYFAEQVGAKHRIFLECDEEQRKRQVTARNTRSGLSSSEFGHLDQMQSSNEMRWIDSSLHSAHKIHMPIIHSLSSSDPQ